jgi:hypothetical protein
MRTLITALIVALLSGCITVPSPETVAQGCARERVEATANGHSTERRHTNRVSVRCEDHKALYEHATSTLETTRNSVTTAGAFNARDKEEATSLSSSVTTGKYGLDVRSRVERKEKSGWVWSVSSGLVISH